MVFLDLLLDDTQATRQAVPLLLTGKKEYSQRQARGVVDVPAEGIDLFLQELVRDLGHDTRPVARSGIGRHGTPWVTRSPHVRAISRMRCERRPLESATNPTPHESCSIQGS